MSVGELKARAAWSRDWLFDAAFPLWAGAGFDPHARLFHERLDADANPVAGLRRTRVQARQTYVYVEAGRMGWPGPWKERAAAGLAVIAGPARAPGGAVGYGLDESANLIDPRRDLYDQAFALFALAHARSLDEACADARIADILAYLETQRLAPGGFAEGELRPKPRWQNPHMHLFEAGLALAETKAAPAAAAGARLAREMAGLFELYFYDGEHGALGEYYNDDWTRAPGDAGRVCEPGHHCEWIWLLDRWRRASGEDHAPKADRLWAHAIANGQNGPVLIDEAWRDGGAKTPTARLWPQTERLKAALVRFERSGRDAEAADVVKAHDGLKLYFDGLRPGLWRDRRTQEGAFVDEPAPASSFYHIVLAFSELMRVGARA